MNNWDDNKFIKRRFGNHNFLGYSFSTLLSVGKAVFRKVTHGLFTFNAAPFNSPHSLEFTTAFFNELGWFIFLYPAYLPDLAPSDFLLFPYLSDFLGG